MYEVVSREFGNRERALRPARSSGPKTGLKPDPGQKLGESYQAASLPVLHRRLSQAGLRPAMVLNEAFDGK